MWYFKNMIDQIEIVISFVFFFFFFFLQSIAIAMETVYKQTPALINIHQKEGKWEKECFLNFYDRVWSGSAL